MRKDARVETSKALVLNHLPRTVYRIRVQNLPHPRTSLILHPRLDKVNGVNHEGTKSTRDAPQRKVVRRLQGVAKKALRRRGCLAQLSRCRAERSGTECVRALPRGINDFSEVAQGQPTGGRVEAGEVEEDVGLHRREEGEASDACCFIEEVGAGDLAIVAFLGGVADNELNEVHFTNDVLEGADIGVGDLGASGDVAQGVKVFEQMIGELVLGRFQNDSLEVFGLDVAVAVLIKVLKRLPYPLPLKTAQHLRKLRVGHVVAVFLAADVERGPFAIPVKGNRFPAFVLVVELLEVLVLDDARAILIKETECNFVLGVGLGEEVFESAPVVDVDSAFPLAVGDAEEDCVLLTFDLVLWRRMRQISLHDFCWTDTG